MIIEDIVSSFEKVPASKVTHEEAPAPPPKISTLSDEEECPMPETGWTCLNFPNPVLFLTFFDPFINRADISQGDPILYPWQVEIGELLGGVKPTLLKPFKFCLCAANGSGKDAFVIAPFAVWFICSKIRARVIITSASGVQLTTQTESYISSLAQKINVWNIKHYGKPLLKVRKRRITCLSSGSEILLFATDEGSKAEGYHPIEPNAEMAIIVNEAKSVHPDIFSALRRCTGYNYWLNVSTPGEPIGNFFQSFESWPNTKRVTYYDCPRHQSPDEFETDRRELGEHDPLFRSKWLALFTFVGGKTVIEQDKVERLRTRIKNDVVSKIKGEIRIGIDVALSTHGDETVLVAFNGNVQTHMITFRVKDAEVVAGNLEADLLNVIKVKKDHKIKIDDGNVGRAVGDILKHRGWTNIVRILNQSAAKQKKMYRNRGAEIWYKFKKLVENGCVILRDDDKLYKQITSRKFKESIAGIDKLCLEAKEDTKSQGLPSPDRADAVALALCDVDPQEWIPKNVQVEDVKGPRLSKLEEMQLINLRLRQVVDRETAQSKKKLFGSVSAITHRGRMLPWMTKKN